MAGLKARAETDDHEGTEGPDVHAGIHWSPIYSWGVPHPAHDQGTPSRRRLVLAVLLACIVGVAAGVGLAVIVSTTSPSGRVPSSTPTSSATGAPAAGAPADAAALAKETEGALVDIDVVDSYQAVEGAGTGMVLTSSGVVLTNNHVIEGETSVSVRDVGNGRTYQADVLGYDRSQDVAVLQLVGAAGLATVELGDSSKAAVGDGVVAVGNAEGAGGTPSHVGGAITAIDQSITAQDEIGGSSEQLTGLFETNADIVPGDSGGSLVDEAGKVIGMVTAASEGFEFGAVQKPEGYAVPIATARSVAAQIVQGTASSTIHVGATAFLGVDVEGLSGTSGAVIADVLTGGPADRAGLAPGDTITAVDGTPIGSPEVLTDVLLGMKPGAKVTIDYLDLSGQQLAASATLVSGPPQ